MPKYLDEVLTRAPGAWIQATDPAIANPTWMAVDVLWIDTTSTPHVWKKRNATNDGWDTLSIGAPPSGAAGGVLDGTYPNPGLAASVAGDGLAETSNVLSVNVDGSTLEISSDALRQKDAGTTNAKLANMAANTIKSNLTGSSAVPADNTIVNVQAALATARVNAQTGTSYTLDATDNGKVVTLNNASPITLTVPSGLGAGFNCLIVQKGAGQVTFTPSSTTVNNRQSHTKTAGQHAVCSLVADVADNFYLGGDTAA